MNERILRNVHPLGMCQNDSEYGESISLPSGQVLSITKEGQDGVCIALDASAARYTTDELEAVGEGNLNMGMMRVIGVIRESPEEFVDGQPRPFEPIEQ